jgi:hypothetical protein
VAPAGKVELQLVMAKQQVQVIPLNVLINGVQNSKGRSQQKPLAAQKGGSGSGNKANTRGKQKPVVQPDDVPPHMQDEAQQHFDPVDTPNASPRHVQDTPTHQRRIVVKNVSVSVAVQVDSWQQQTWDDDTYHEAASDWQPQPSPAQPPVQETPGDWTPDAQPSEVDIPKWIVTLIAFVVSLISTMVFWHIFL